MIQTPHYQSAMRRIRRIHFVGIGGAGMSGIAEVLLNLGYQISGSDVQKTPVTMRLEEKGAQIFYGHAAAHVTDVDVVVLSTIIDEQNPEYQAAKNARIPVVRRAEMLAEIMRFRYGIAVSGTHGKTTTTSLIVSLLADAGMDPTYVIGGILNSAGTNAHLGAGEARLFVAEADESDASFLYLYPMMTVVTNIDADHLGAYQNDFACLKKTFIEFIHHLPFYGLVILCIDDPVVREILPSIRRPMLTYGFHPEADLRIASFEQRGMRTFFSVMRKENSPLSIQLNLPGRHNALNAVAAIGAALELKVPDEKICHALNNFAGVGRRMQIHGKICFSEGDAIVMDDYGHHPREMAVTFDAVKMAYPDRRIVVVFQPHRFSRTQDLFQDFVEVLSGIPNLILLEIYAAGEKPIDGISSQALAKAVFQKTGKEPLCVDSRDALFATLKTQLRSHDLLLLQGAGNIGGLASQLIQEALS